MVEKKNGGSFLKISHDSKSLLPPPIFFLTCYNLVNGSTIFSLLYTSFDGTKAAAPLHYSAS